VKSGTLARPNAWRSSRCSLSPTSASRRSVLATHQTENRKQLGLVEQALAETTSAARERRPGDLQGDAGKRQESDFGDCTSCLDREQQFRTVGYAEVSLR
jgi:hypothetical protein